MNARLVDEEVFSNHKSGVTSYFEFAEDASRYFKYVFQMLIRIFTLNITLNS